MTDMNDPARIKQRYRQFADTECRGYSNVYYELALAVSEDDEVIGFIAEMPVIQPNLFFAAIQLLTGPDSVPKTGPELRPELAALAPAQSELRYLLARTLFTNGKRRDQLLAHAHVHGADVTWL
jgi:hypothetical protein